jgi:hypothetical protein
MSVVVKPASGRLVVADGNEQVPAMKTTVSTETYPRPDAEHGPGALM